MSVSLPFAGNTVPSLSRRNFLGGLAASAAALASGCLKPGNDTGTTHLTPSTSTNNTYVATPIATFAHDFPAAALVSASRFGVVARTRGNTSETNAVISIDDGGSEKAIQFADSDSDLQYINHATQLPNGNGYVFVSNGGLYFANADLDPDSATFLAHANGANVGSSAIVFGSRLFVATSSLEEGGREGKVAGKGTITVYNMNNEGQPLSGSVNHIDVGTNPSSMAIRPGTNEIVVLNSGNELDPNSSITFIKPDSLEQRTINLPSGIVGQFSGDLAISDNGRYAFFGTSDGSGMVHKVNLDNPEDIVSLSLETEFHSSVNYANGTIFVSSYNEGRVDVIDANTFELIDTITLGAEAGPARVSREGTLIQMVRGGAFEII